MWESSDLRAATPTMNPSSSSPISILLLEDSKSPRNSTVLPPLFYIYYPCGIKAPNGTKVSMYLDIVLMKENNLSCFTCV